MKSTRKSWRVAVATGAVAGMLLIAGCSDGGSDPAPGADETGGSENGGSSEGSSDAVITFQWWGNEERAALTDEAIDIFEERTGITVQTSYSTIDSYIPKLATQLASGSGAPDLFLIPMESVREYDSKGALADLTAYVGDGINVDQISEQNQQIGTIDGKVVGFTLGTATNAMFYDRSIWADAGLDEPTGPVTWDDFITFGEAIRNATDGDTAALSDPGGLIAWFEVWLIQEGKELFTAQGDLGFDDSDLLEWFTLMETLRESGATTDASTTATLDQSMQNSGLARGLSAAEFAAGSLAGAYIDTLGEDRVGIAAFPSNTDISGLSMAGTNVTAVSEHSSHKDEAVALLDFLLNDPEGGAILGLTRGIPLNDETYASLSSDFSGGDQMVSDFITSIQDQLVNPSPLAPPGASTLPAEFTLTYERIIFDDLTKEDGATALFAFFQSELGLN